MKNSLIFLALLILCIDSIGKQPILKSPEALLNNPAFCNIPQARADLDIANVRTTILSGGDFWWDLLGNAKYEVPKGSGKHSLFTGAIWIGGFDQGKNLRVASQTYRQGNAIDWTTGPLKPGTGTTDSTECAKFDKVYKISRAEVKNFVNKGVRTPAIDTWPGNGDQGYSASLAPYFDKNGDGKYNPGDGDYPYYELGANPVCLNRLLGDQTLWWVFNDKGRNHLSSLTPSIGLEIQAQAFAFASGDKDLSNSTFYKYKIINRSSTQLDSTSIGLYSDPDLGYYNDDYIGCDVGRSMGFCYNADNNDETSAGYGLNPPAIGIDILQGPVADPGDKIDNNRNGVIDEQGETIGMSNFQFFYNNISSVMGDPSKGSDFYNYMNSRWKDGVPVTYGGDGRGAGSGATSIPCKFMYPVKSDPAFTATWDEVSAGNLPADRRFLQSTGRFTLAPGGVNYITFAAIWSRPNNTNNLAVVDSLKKADDKIQKLFDDCFYFPSGVTSNKIKPSEAKIFPNPFSELTIIDFEHQENDIYQVSIFNIDGKMVRRSDDLTGHNYVLHRNELSSGLYFFKIQIKGSSRSYSGKFMIQ